MTGMSMYVRVKRKKQTIFLHCDPGDTVLQVKEKIEVVTTIPPASQRLLLGKQSLEEASSLCDCGITPSDTGTGEDRWEDVDVYRSGVNNVGAAAPAMEAPPPEA